MRHSQSEGLREFPDGTQAALLAVLLRQDMLLRGGQQTEALCRRALDPYVPFEAVEQSAADLVLLQHRPDRLLLVQRGLPRAAALCIRCQRPLQFVGQSQVIDDQSARLVPEHAVNPRDGLHQPVAAHRLVHVHRMQAWRIEAG